MAIWTDIKGFPGYEVSDLVKQQQLAEEFGVISMVVNHVIWKEAS